MLNLAQPPPPDQIGEWHNTTTVIQGPYKSLKQLKMQV